MQLRQSKFVSKDHIGLRLDACALALYPLLGSRSQAKKWIKKGFILLCDQPTDPARFVQVGDRIDLCPSPELPSPLDIDLEIPFEDAHVLVANKPAGLFISGKHPKTLVRALRQHTTPSTEPDALPFAQPVHRLDQRTSGLVVSAKSRRALIALGQAFEERTVRKRYCAIVCGHLEAGQSTAPIEGKTAQTSWHPTQYVRSLHTEWLTVLDVHINTGRTHQIRRHLSEIGHPILGDDLYSEGPVLKSKGLFLCATQLSFPHPIHDLTVECQIAPPAKFHSQLAREAHRWQKYHG